MYGDYRIENMYDAVSAYSLVFHMYDYLSHFALTGNQDRIKGTIVLVVGPQTY